MGRETGTVRAATPRCATRLSRWHPYPAMVPDELAVSLAQQIILPGDKVLDPFCGSGRLLFAAAGMGGQCVGLDVNPLACLITEAKAAVASIETISEIVRECAAAQRTAPAVDGLTLRNTSVSWYSSSVGQELAQIIAWLNSLGLRQPDLLVVATALSAAARDASWIRKSGWKLHRMAEAERVSRASSAWQSFHRRLQCYVSGATNQPRAGKVEVRRIRSDGVSSKEFGQFDAIITSPPYGDSRTTVQYGAASAISLDIVSRLRGLEEIYLPGLAIDKACLGGQKTTESVTNLKRYWAGSSGGEANERVSTFLLDFSLTCKHLAKLSKQKSTIAMIVGRRSVGGYRVKFDEFAVSEMEGLGFTTDRIERRSLRNKSLPRTINKFARASSTEEREKGMTKTMDEEIVLVFKKGKRCDTTFNSTLCI